MNTDQAVDHGFRAIIFDLDGTLLDKHFDDYFWEQYLPVSGKLRLESQSARARQVVESFMRIGQTLRAFPEAAAVDHARVQHALVEVIADVVVPLADGPRTLWHDNGVKRGEGAYLDGKRHGVWTEWRKSGEKKSRVSSKLSTIPRNSKAPH